MMLKLPSHLIPGTSIKKVCACGIAHSTIPEEIKIWDEDGAVVGIQFDCQCKSTLFIPAFDLKTTKKREDFMKREFKNTGDDFSGFYEAERYARSLGFCVGSMERSYPIGLHKGAAYVSKWTRMTRAEQELLDGRLEGDFREGTVTLILKGE